MKRTTTNIKSAMTRFFSLLLTAFVAVSNLNAQEVTIDGLVYRLSESSAMVMHVEEGNVSKIFHIPDKISYDGQDYVVDSIGYRSFSRYKESREIVEEIYAPACTYIGAEAFRGCTNLKKIEFPECTYIDYAAFYGCGLEIVSLPKCKTIIDYAGVGSFQDCTNLTQVTLPMCNTIEDYTFMNCTNLERISLPMCNTIGVGAFCNDSILKDVYAPLCTYVGGSAFSGCTSLKTICLDNCNGIGESAFKNCTSLQEIYLPMVSLLGEGSGNYSYAYTFSGCVQLQSIDLPMCKIIGIKAFEGCTSLKYVSLGKAIDSIGDGAFNGCKNLLTFKVHSIITPTVGTDAFGSDNRIYSNCELYIPTGREIAYNSADGWKNFVVIKAMDGSEPGLPISQDVNQDGKVDSQDVLEIYDYMQKH